MKRCCEARLPSACIFDFDGVIMDSEKYHHLGWKKVAADLGVDFTYEEYGPYKSAGQRVLIPYLLKKAGKPFTEEEFQRLNKLRVDSMDTEILKVSEDDLLPGVIDFIKMIKSHGIKTGVASASTHSREVATRFGLLPLFDVFVDGNQNLPHKPSPDIFLYAAKLLNVDPADCVGFEDSINGILAIKAAGMKCIGVQSHFCDKQDVTIDTYVGQTLDLIKLH